jgi:transcription initiation factor TFIIH subunit 4
MALHWSDGRSAEQQQLLFLFESLSVQTILHFMVSSGPGQNPAKPSQGVLHLLQRSGLMANPQYVESLITHNHCFSGCGQSGPVLQISSAGFQFLLHSPHDQLWDLLLQYLHMAEVGFTLNPQPERLTRAHKESQMDIVEVLSFLFMLSTMQLGQVYSCSRLPNDSFSSVPPGVFHR